MPLTTRRVRSVRAPATPTAVAPGPASIELGLIVETRTGVDVDFPARLAMDVTVGRATTTPICSDSSHPAQNREFDVPKTMRRSRRPHAATDCLAHFALDRALSYP